MSKLNKEIDKVFSEVGFQEKLYCWFNRCRKQVYLAVGVILILLLFMICYVIVHDKKINKMQNDYLSLTTTYSKLNFIKKYKAQPLCGLVLMDLGDEAVRKEDLQNALLYYNLAAKAFNNNEMRIWADISYALTKLSLGDKIFFVKSLDEILHNDKVSSHFRADALYKLVNFFKAENNEVKIEELMHYAKGLDMSDNWKKYIEGDIK